MFYHVRLSGKNCSLAALLTICTANSPASIISQPSLSSLLRFGGRGRGGMAVRSCEQRQSETSLCDYKDRLTDLRTTRATDSIAPVFSAPSFTCATTIHLQSPDPSMPTPSPAYVRPRFLLPLGGESGRAGPTSVGIGSRTRRNSGSRKGDAASCACSEAMGLVAGRSAGNGLRLTNRFNEDCCGVAVGVVLEGPGSTGSTNHGTGRSCSSVEEIERLRAAEGTLEAATGAARRVLVHTRSTCMSRVR